MYSKYKLVRTNKNTIISDHENIFVDFQKYISKKDMDGNEHERLSNYRVRTQIK